MKQDPFERIFDIRCAEYMGYDWNEFNLDFVGTKVCYAPTRDGWDVPVPYDPINNMEQLLEVAEKLFAEDAFAWEDYTLELKDDGLKEALIRIVGDCLVSTEDRRELFEERDTPYEDLTKWDQADDALYLMNNEEQKTEQEKFNEACMNTMDFHVGRYNTDVASVYNSRCQFQCTLDEWDPFNNLMELNNIVDTISFRTGFARPYVTPEAHVDERMQIYREYVMDFMKYPERTGSGAVWEQGKAPTFDSYFIDTLAEQLKKMCADCEDDAWLNAPAVGKEFGGDSCEYDAWLNTPNADSGGIAVGVDSREYEPEETITFDVDDKWDFIEERERLSHTLYGGCYNWRDAYDAELKFNCEAARMKHLVEGPGYCLDLSTWNPWENAAQLERLVSSLKKFTEMEFLYPVSENWKDAAQDYVMVCARTPEIEEHLMERLIKLYGDADWFDKARFYNFIDSLRVESDVKWNKEYADLMHKMVESTLREIEPVKATDTPLTLVGYVADGEFHETPATRRHDDDYWAARLLVLGGYRQATGNVYTNCHWEYIVEVRPRYGYADTENELVEYNVNMAQAVFLEEYIRNESYYSDTLWQQATRQVDKPDDDELNPESVYNWRLGILQECLRLLSIAAKDNTWIQTEFNDLCMKIAEAYCISWADTQRGDWNPYDNEEQLKWVFDVVVNYAGVQFVMYGDINGGLKQVGLDDSMRNYIFENGKGILSV